MTVSVLVGLILQGGALWIVHMAIHGRWLRRPAALLLIAAVNGHGATEVMQWAWPGRNPFRQWISQAAMDDWILLVSFAILVYAVTYAFVVRNSEPAGRADRDYVAGLPLKVLLAVVVPLLVVTWQGRGALAPVALGQTAARDDYVTTGLAGQFLVPAVAMTGTVILVRYGTRWLIPLFAAQGIMLALAGTRTMIVSACLLSLVGACLCGVRPTRKQAAWVVVVVVFFTMLISSARFAAGRETFSAGQGAEGRIEGLVGGVSALGSGKSNEAILDDVVYRFDSNTFGALVLQGLRSDVPPVGLATLKNSVLLMVPSFLNTGKLDSSLEARNEEAFIDRRFGIDQGVDWLPGLFGAMVSYFGPLGLLALAGMLGALFAAAEVVVLRKPTPARFVLGIGLAQCALLYVSGPQMVFITLRGVLLFVALLWIAGRLKATYESMSADRNRVVAGDR